MGCTVLHCAARNAPIPKATALWPSGLVTVTSARPRACVGVVQVIAVEFQTHLDHPQVGGNSAGPAWLPTV